MSYKTPPQTHTADGKPRRVGFELEFTGLTLEQTCEVLEKALHGQLESGSAAEKVLRVGGLGAFNIELDWDYLKRKAADVEASGDDPDWVKLLTRAAGLVVPMEVVCPPIMLDQLGALDTLVQALREAGAAGTEDSPLAAYGVHINPEIPALDATTLSPYLRAFALLQWWLVDAHEVDVTRRVSPYIDLYPEAYLQSLLSRPSLSMEQIFSDYLEHNPTRNRALDMLPMLAEIDSERVRSVVDDPKIKSRPTFHYRLPNCHIERPDWSLSLSWNTWWVVEKLAWQPDALEQLGQAYLDQSRPLLGVNRKQWTERMQRWLSDQGWV